MHNTNHNVLVIDSIIGVVTGLHLLIRVYATSNIKNSVDITTNSIMIDVNMIVSVKVKSKRQDHQYLIVLPL